MIVRNEASRIERCLRFALPSVSSYAILDTGSTDDTVAVIERLAVEHGVTGRLGHLPFIDFSQARNAALDLRSSRTQTASTTSS